MTTRLVCAAKTDVGLKRQRNEDNFCMVPSQGLYILADGMGGHSSGQVASTLCVKHVSQFICEMAKQPGFQFMYPPNPQLSYEANLLANAIKFANERVYIQSCKDRSMEGMGTTCTSVFNAPQGIIIAWVGDSRIYRIRKGQITQVSRDHSLINHLLDTGELKPEDVKSYGKKNIILRAIGLKENVEVDVREFKREQGDVYLMCSDGLSDLVSDQQICQTVTNAASLDEACNILIGLALKAGGKDNVTVVTVCVEQEDGVTAQPPRHVSTSTMPAAAPQPTPYQAGNPPMAHPAPAPTPMGPVPVGKAPAPKSRMGMPPAAMPRNGMAPMPTAQMSPAVAQPVRMHSIREYILTEAIPVAKRSMPKPPSARGGMPNLPGQKPKPIVEQVVEPKEASVSQEAFDDDDDDETCETRIQSREEILREIGMATVRAAANVPPTPDVQQPRLVNAQAVKEAETPLPSPELLLTAPPAAANGESSSIQEYEDFENDDDAGPKTQIDNIIPNELFTPPSDPFVDDVPRPNPVSSEALAARNASAEGLKPASRISSAGSVPSVAKPPAPPTPPAPPSFNYGKSSASYVAPKEAIKPPSSYDDDDDDSIEINATPNFPHSTFEF